MACLCAPTTHAGSFRCRLHRGNQWGSRSPGSPSAPPPVPRAPVQRDLSSYRDSDASRIASSAVDLHNRKIVAPSSPIVPASNAVPHPGIPCSPIKHFQRKHSVLARPSYPPCRSSAAGPSRLSRMVVAEPGQDPVTPPLKDCADDATDLSHSTALVQSVPYIRSVDSATAAALGVGGARKVKFREHTDLENVTNKAVKIKTRANTFKQSEASCRIVGTKGASLMMSRVF